MSAKGAVLRNEPTKAKFLAERHCRWRGAVEHSSPTPQHGNMREEQHKQSLLSTLSPRLFRTRSQPHRLMRSEVSVYLPACRILDSLCSTCKPCRSNFEVFFWHYTIQRLCKSFLSSFQRKMRLLLIWWKPGTRKAGRKSLELLPMASLWAKGQTCGFHGIFKSFPRYLLMTHILLGLVNM